MPGIESERCVRGREGLPTEAWLGTVYEKQWDHGGTLYFPKMVTAVSLIPHGFRNVTKVCPLALSWDRLVTAECSGSDAV